MESIYLFPLALLIIILILIVIAIVCTEKDIYPWDIPGELWDYFTWHLPKKRFLKQVVLKHKKGDMCGVIEMTPGQFIDARYVVCRKITAQDVINTNLDLLAWKLMSEDRPLTWEEKAKEVSCQQLARRAVLTHGYYGRGHSVPEELLKAILKDKESLETILECHPYLNVIRYMEDDGNDTAGKIMNLLRERKEKKAC